ncbi:MAG TPA: PHP domain-containing protein [Phycisphaerae bacterium]|nr:PHP domain-containing protein [Phycisphaerae bacterium]
MSKNQELAQLFSKAADVMALLDENSFRVLATRKVARALEELGQDVSTLSESGKLEEISGIGKHSAEKIREYLRTGHITEFESLAKQVPTGVLDLLAVGSIGAKTAYLLWKEAGITSLDELKAALEKGKIPSIKGLGEKKLARIRQNLEFIQGQGKRIGIGVALPVARQLCDALRELAGVKNVQYCGSLRRGLETIGDVDILLSAPNSKMPAITEFIKSHTDTAEVIAAGETKVSIRTKSLLQVDFRVVPPESWGAALQYFTGSKEHNVRVREMAIKKGMKLNEWGLYKGEKSIAGLTEVDIYDALELAWLPPEMREDRGEVELASAMYQVRKNPKFVVDNPKLEFLGKHIPTSWPELQISDIQADLHMHTTASDGTLSLEDMVAEAKRRGRKYIAITDHSKSQVQANGLKVDRLMEHIKAIHALAAKTKGITVLAGSEVDILADGSLDYPDEVLEKLDWVVASPHAALTQESEAATARLIRVASNPLVDVIGHPTGRLVAVRRGLEPDMQRVIFAAARGGVALEINAHDLRLDLRDVHVRMAVEAGVPLCINTDAHGAADMDNLIYGVITARRGWARAQNVLNTWPLEKMLKWQKERGKN